MRTKILALFITALLAVNIQTEAQESTTVLLDKAKVKAKKEGKAIFIKFEASWCGWCHRMTKNMKAESTKKFFEDNFVSVPVVVFESPKNKKLENPGSEDLVKKYKGEKAGLPFWVILDSDLNLITDSFDSRGQNLGCPASKEEVKAFIKKLKKVVPEFTKDDATMISKQFILKK
ncbi:thioredoxin family protein [Pseudotenacibaculum sp. MALMAid0570]|uniref:thioredoxin family protein n=1 Tax=Pseudotenacibaculum sp. MALMAid0570 TaxID=3143938 RepID=UPI0032DECBC8